MSNEIIEAAKTDVSAGFATQSGFELMQRVGKMLTNSSLVPESYRTSTEKYDPSLGRKVEVTNVNALPNAIVALHMANRMNADPLMVMQNLYIIEGRPSWSSQWIISSINGCGRFSPLRFEIKKLGKKTVEYSERVGYDKQDRRAIYQDKKIEIEEIECVAWVIEKESGDRLESPTVSISMAVREGWYQKSGSKWKTMPEVMLRYRAASFFGKLYAPELLMGLPTADESKDMAAQEIPEAVVHEPAKEIVTEEEVKQSMPEYEDSEFEKNFESWKKIIESGRADAQAIINRLETKYQLTDEQKKRIQDIEIEDAEEQGEVTEND